MAGREEVETEGDLAKIFCVCRGFNFCFRLQGSDICSYLSIIIFGWNFRIRCEERERERGRERMKEALISYFCKDVISFHTFVFSSHHHHLLPSITGR